jgi:hypothetical protein
MAKRMNIICKESSATDLQFVWVTNTLDAHRFFNELDCLNGLSLFRNVSYDRVPS